jgi:hypothetical protein
MAAPSFHPVKSPLTDLYQLSASIAILDYANPKSNGIRQIYSCDDAGFLGRLDFDPFLLGYTRVPDVSLRTPSPARGDSRFKELCSLLRTLLMPIPVTCPKCGTQSHAPDAAAGKRSRCKCGEIIAIPAVGQGVGKASVAKPSMTAPAPESKESSLIDVLTDRDFQQTQTNPYAVTEKTATSDAEALRTYLRNEQGRIAPVKESQGNLALIVAGFFFGLIKNIFLIVAVLALMHLVPQIGEAIPFLRLGGIYLAILSVYAILDLAAGVGVILRKNWGWWLALVGLGWIISERLVAFIAMLMVSEDIPRLVGFGIGSSIAGMIATALIHSLVQPKIQQKFNVKVPVGLAWALALLVPLVLEGIFFACSYSALRQMAESP